MMTSNPPSLVFSRGLKSCQILAPPTQTPNHNPPPHSAPAADLRRPIFHRFNCKNIDFYGFATKPSKIQQNSTPSKIHPKSARSEPKAQISMVFACPFACIYHPNAQAAETSEIARCIVRELDFHSSGNASWHEISNIFVF